MNCRARRGSRRTLRAVSESPAILVLPAEVANQIAAGEVVERPASVVKELVENGLDAGARTITVSIDGGGLARIAITDDGHGMSPEDLALSVVRHATSKIRAASDLFGVGTYGFRGEALASIGSVSRLVLTSRRRDASEGCEVRLDGSATPALRPVGCAVGTTVSVEDLFFNTPARRKFLRTAQTEWGACADTVQRLALPRPDVRFVLRKDGKTSREFLRRDTIAERVREMWPDEILTEIDGRRGPVRVQAFLGPPERARSGTAGIAVYVNGRFVRDKVLLRAVAQAYGSTLDGGRYPPGAIVLEVSPSEVDVNVHPQKAEVRFAQQNEVFSSVVTLLREGLASAPWARALLGAPTHASRDDGWGQRFTGAPYEPSHPPRPYAIDRDRANSPASPPRSLFDRAPSEERAPSSPFGPPVPDGDARASADPSPAPSRDDPLSSASRDPWGLEGSPSAGPFADLHATAAASMDGLSPPAPDAPARHASPFEIPHDAHDTAPTRDALDAMVTALARGHRADTGMPERQTFASLRFVAQVRRMFLICEGEWGLVMLDQHAASERVVFDRLRRGYASREVRVQPLLVHETLEVSAREVALAEEHADHLARVGFELTSVGPNTLAVRAVPALLGRADPRRLARDILAEIARKGSDFSRALDLVLATMACHGSVRGGDDVPPEEARALLASLDECDFGGHCPHGRPVLFSIKWSELERRVGR
jgi:DNA mismatch repair protein MutL